MVPKDYFLVGRRLKPPQNAEDPHRRFALTKVTEMEMEASPSKLKTLFSGLHFGADEEYSDSTNDSEGGCRLNKF